MEEVKSTDEPIFVHDGNICLLRESISFTPRSQHDTRANVCGFVHARDTFFGAAKFFGEAKP